MLLIAAVVAFAVGVLLSHLGARERRRYGMEPAHDCARKDARRENTRNEGG